MCFSNFTCAFFLCHCHLGSESVRNKKNFYFYFSSFALPTVVHDAIGRRQH